MSRVVASPLGDAPPDAGVIERARARQRRFRRRGSVAAAVMTAASGHGTFAIWRETPELWIVHADGSDPREIGGLR